LRDKASKLKKYSPKIHVLANVAGTFDSFASADTVSRSSWDHILATNLTAPVMMMKAVLPFMKAEGKGAIINVGGKASTSGGAAGIAYTASKAGLLGATKNVAWRFRGMGISCNAVLPGGVAATGTSGLQEQEHGDEWDEAAYATVK
jgi:NAD(P)-dependent dehydrogenase (short-subunit alcohol dehydrogenase family)